MTTLDRYLLREILLPFAVGLGLFFVVVAFAQILKISDSVTGLGITGSEVFQALIYSLPPLMGLLIPVSTLFATLLGVGRLASDKEVVALCAGGVSPYRLLRTPAMLGAFLGLCSAFALTEGEPWGIQGLRALMSRSAQRTLARGVRVGEFNQWVNGVTFFAAGRQDGELRDILFADQRDRAQPVIISARRGVIQSGGEVQDLVFNLRDGAILLNDRDARTYRVLHFERSRYRVDVGQLVGNKARTLSPVQEKSLMELWDGSHDPSRSPAQRALLTITLHRKAALPMATLIFALLAVPLACRAAGSARARGFLYSAGIVGAYYYIGRAVELMARSGRFPPVLAAWVPNIIGILVLLFMLARFRRGATS